MSGLAIDDWDTIIERIQEGKFTPIINDTVIDQMLPGRSKFLSSWAEASKYPLEREVSITRVARHISFDKDEDAAKRSYLLFAKRHLIRSIEEEVNGNGRLPETKPLNEHKMRFSEIATQSGYFDANNDNPLSLLAKLPLPIYITTSYYNFIELALEAEGKTPRTEICYWDDKLRSKTMSAMRTQAKLLRKIMADAFNEEELEDLCFEYLDIEYEDIAGDTRNAKVSQLVKKYMRHNKLAELIEATRKMRPSANWEGLSGELGPADGVPSVFDREPNYIPTVDEPLVYHLHGIDTHVASLILTEDDYFDFLIKVSWDKDKRVVRPRISQALADTSLLMLGYDLQDWAFKVLFRGLITAKRDSLRQVSVSIQLKPEYDDAGEQETQAAQKYLERYFFDRARFRIYWGEAQNFIDELWQHWQRFNG